MRRTVGGAAALALLMVAAPALAGGGGHDREAAGLAASALPAGVPELPLLHAGETPGDVVTTPAEPPAVTPGAHVVDGAIADWVGTPTNIGGRAVISSGELVYTDHLFDAYGADDGQDVDRVQQLAPLNEAFPEMYRIEPVFSADVLGEVGVDDQGLLSSDEYYGNAGRIDAADLVEVRVAADASTIYLLARTTTMLEADDTAVVVLADTVPGSPPYDVPFGTGLTTDAADVAVVLTTNGGSAVDLATGAATGVATVGDPTGYVNAIEAAIPRALLGDGPLRLAIAAGAFDPATGGFADLPDLGANVANVGFRTGEPITTWFDQQQAFALYGQSIDEFLLDIPVADLVAGRNDTWTAGPGYHDRLFLSDPAISSEGGTEGIYQHYGVYVPSAYDPAAAAPLTFWLHWRGGKAHSAAALAPRILRDQGEAFGGLVVSPRGRGTSSWYLGRGLVDVNEVSADVVSTFSVDENRVYVSGHSMGGWGSYLLSILYPDRFAAAFPVAGPVTQGAWTGLDFDGCDDLQYDEYSPCYIETNESDPRIQHTRRLLENLRNVPLAIYQGAIDELVPLSGVTRQVQRLVELGYRHRYYVFPTYEHYSHPVIDEWAEGARYIHGFTRNPNPARVTYVRDMPFERTVETGPSQENPTVGLSFDFDHAYWMSELTPIDGVSGVAHFDGVSLALPADPALQLPEAGGPASAGQVGPFAMTGLWWADNPLAAVPALANGFEATLSGASAVRLDVARMGIDVSQPVTATVTADGPLTLRLAGAWSALPVVSIDGVPVAASLEAGVLTFAVPAAGAAVVIAPKTHYGVTR